MNSPPEEDSSKLSSLWHLQTFQKYWPQTMSKYKTYEDAFVKEIKDKLIGAREHPELVLGAAVATGLLMRGPRRFVFRQTIGRFRSLESQFNKVENGLKDLSNSVSSLSKECKAIVESAKFGEEEMQRGRTKIRAAGKEIQRLVKSIYKVESEARDLLDGLRAIPGREALQLRKEVADMQTFLKNKRQELDNRIVEISELRVRV